MKSLELLFTSLIVILFVGYIYHYDIGLSVFISDTAAQDRPIKRKVDETARQTGSRQTRVGQLYAQVARYINTSFIKE